MKILHPQRRLPIMQADLTAELPQSQRDRLKHIELRLRFLGEVRRPDLMQRFGIQSAAASRDLALYKELAPENVDYESRGKRYLLGAGFSPLFAVPSAQVLGWLTEQLGDATAPSSEALLPCLIDFICRAAADIRNATQTVFKQDRSHFTAGTLCIAVNNNCTFVRGISFYDIRNAFRVQNRKDIFFGAVGQNNSVHLVFANKCL